MTAAAPTTKKEATMKERTFSDPTHKYWTITARPFGGGMLFEVALSGEDGEPKFQTGEGAV